jgi:hypothetical protein
MSFHVSQYRVRTPRRGDTVMLNPQPLPPGGEVMLNPQPLPPRYSLSSIIIVGG